jgi:protein-S-isoprenylcysteine O-methyltransferase Ste14
VLTLEAGVEERALLWRNPAYADDRRRTWRFLPWIF